MNDTRHDWKEEAYELVASTIDDDGCLCAILTEVTNKDIKIMRDD
tara:strand:+ start:446 stop:580 length:135 start_codon:yes stop_codon:yes gene_type:complete